MMVCAITLFASPAMSATIAVTTTTDERADPGPGTGCSLREAIQSVNNAASYGGCANTGAAYGTSDTINIPAGTYTTTIAGAGEDLNATGDYDINRSVAIVGAGAGSTFINGGALDRVFDIIGAFTVSFSGVTIQNGNTAGDGGGIQNSSGTLTVTNSTISGNTASWGGGIFSNAGTTTVTNSTITSNTATDNGGGILNDVGTVTVTNSTISGNTTTGNGGGIANGGGTATITNSTIVRNTALANQGGGYRLFAGTGAFTNSIVADNGAGLDCVGAITDNGGNIDSDGNCGTFTQNAAMVQGTGFGALASNGGATQTHALLAGSAAINTAPTCAGLTTDQRGTARPQGSACDVGAYEYVAVVAPEPTPTPTPATFIPPNLSGSSSVSGSGGGFTVTFTNNGGSVYVYSIGGTGFSITGDNCSSTVIAGHETCQVTVTPSSPITSATTVTLLLYTNALSAPVEVRVQLTPATTLGTITVVSPANAATTGSTVTFEWVPAGGGGYQIYICQNADFTACVAITVNGSSANRVLFAGAGLIFALGLIAPGGRRRFYVLAFALIMFSGAGLVACGSGGGDSSSATSANAKYTSTGLAKGAWFWKVTATGYQSETRTFTVQ